ncbi:PREDICTED: palmitoyltransferase ZDHHC23-like isoform X1 [Rhagoletis zephyria]|uniref:palmitoyltransferase ZDHHC23-like isoform X1 n=1 Tax=Rhagoletis zephyria TaxID=28612 RepID=UPI000811AA21|nr:PREDICTED: palmitoyltransferase ZDHHC23-like isoform X1 [Rhagoletis zephyria]
MPVTFVDDYVYLLTYKMSFFYSWLTCRPVEQFLIIKMLLTFQDRLRIPWRGGSKHATLGSLIPVVAIPLLISLAAINAYTCIILFLTSSVIMCYAFNYVQSKAIRTSFFSIWVFSSLVYLIVLFEFTVPLLELLPEENWALVALSIISLICFYQTRKRAILNHVIQFAGTANGVLIVTETSVSEEDKTIKAALLLEQDMEEIPSDCANRVQPNVCSICSKCVPARTVHCSVCSACIKRHDHHSYWLNCCIGESNHRFYIFGLLFSTFALLLGANLTLTAVCHPFIAANILGLHILLPDDCTEVFDIYEFGLAFVIAAYALMIAAYIMLILVRQIYFISRGTSLHESKTEVRGNNKTLKYNWRNFVFYWLTCRPVEQLRIIKMLLTFQDRLRIPWRGGSKYATLGSLIPVVAIPLLISLAAINAYTCIILFLTSSVIMCYAFNYVQSKAIRTSFFSIWVFSSLVYLIVLFEFTVPLLELLPEENWALVVLSIISLICFYQTRKRAILNHVIQFARTANGVLIVTETSVSEEDKTIKAALLLEQDLEEIQPTDCANRVQPNVCSICSKCVPARTVHCSVCSACIKRPPQLLVKLLHRRIKSSFHTRIIIGR